MAFPSKMAVQQGAQNFRLKRVFHTLQVQERSVKKYADTLFKGHGFVLRDEKIRSD
jgi:hypothetical protein